ncbi:MAG: M23/M56 family metallopeptidase [Candidatus Zhuqueibacterota bacterium]
MIIEIIHHFIQTGKAVIPFFWQNSIYAGIVFFLVWMLIKIFKIQSPRWRYALWLLILIRLILPPNLSHPLSSWNLLGHMPVFERLVHWFDFFGQDDKQGIDYSGDLWNGNRDEGDIASNASTVIPSLEISKHNALLALLFLAWCFGAMVLLIIYLRKLQSFQTTVRQSFPVRSAGILELVDKWSTLFGIRRKVKLVCSEHYLSPFTSGIWSPVIFIPKKAIESRNYFLVEPIIAHEMAHIQRWDNLWMRLFSLLQIAYFFNPMVWFLNSQISLSRECDCDSRVLAKKKISRSHYGNGIMAILKLNLFSAEEIKVLPGFGSQRKKLVYRINNLRGDSFMGKYQSLLLYSTFILVGIFLLPMAGAFIQNPEILPDGAIAAGQSATPVQKENPPFILPIQVGKLTAPYGKWINPFTKKEAFHNGVDVAAPIGTEVTAAASGTVTRAISDDKNEASGNGKYIIIQHENGFETFYSHLDEVLVDMGRHVAAGELIGRVGKTGKSTGPHLHFEIRQDGKAQNPEGFIKFESLKATQ